jgi:deoxyribose-phosphate aldolase
MKISEILSKCDHTLLSQTATWEDIRAVIDDGIKYKTASVCIPPSFVRRAKNYAEGKVKICTVIGFPNGYSTTKTKLFETEEAIASGADEIDMVVNIGEVKAGHFDAVRDEIKILKAATGNKILKVIIETCLLTDEEKIAMCRAVTEAGADFIKTSTGFSTNGATPEDISLFKAHVGEGVRIKAAGGISTLEDAENFIRLGASRLGTSRIVKLVKAEKNIQRY